MDNVAELLAELIKCPSVNPAEQKEFDYPYGERRLAELLGGILIRWGAEVDVTEVSPGRANVIGKFEGKNPTRSILFEAHSDTVAVDGMEIDPFDPVIRDGKIFGRGSCDTKGPMAAILMGIKAVLDADGALPVTVYFASTCDEEISCAGARKMLADGFTCDCAVIGEPTDMKIIHASKGVSRCTIETMGTAAHSSVPADGNNAIMQMRKVLNLIDGPVRETLAGKSHPLLGAPAINVGVISGGSQVNIVPDSCRIDIDRRTIPGESREMVTEDLLPLLEALRDEDSSFEFKCTATQCYPAFEQDPDSDVVKTVAQACRNICGSAEVATAPWAATSGFLKEAGIDCVVFGPGSIEQAHRSVEFIELAALEQGARAYAEIIRLQG